MMGLSNGAHHWYVVYSFHVLKCPGREISKATTGVGKIIWIQGLLLGTKAVVTFCGELHGMARTKTASY